MGAMRVIWEGLKERNGRGNDINLPMKQIMNINKASNEAQTI